MMLAKTLDSATKNIKVYSEKIESNFMKIALELNNVSEWNMYVGRYDNISAYAEEEFGFRKSMTYNLINIAKKYIDGDNLHSSLPHGDRDYSVGQLIALLPIDHDEAEGLINDEVINEYSSVREIKSAVKEYKNKHNNSIVEDDNSIVEDDNSIIEDDNSITEEDETEQLGRECADIFFELNRAITRLEGIVHNEKYIDMFNAQFRSECTYYRDRLNVIIR